MAKPSQVVDEVWDDERVRSFLALDPTASLCADHHVLLKAYRGMRPKDFKRFLVFFIAAGRDLEARNARGKTIWQIISQHRHGVEFVAIKQSLVMK